MSKMQFRQLGPEDLAPGRFALFAKTLSDTDTMLYAGISGEMSPLCLNETFAQTTPLKTRTVHPMLVAALTGGAILRLLPPAVQTVSREFRFLASVFTGDTVTARAEITAADPATRQVRLAVTCYNQREELVMEGSCTEIIVTGEGMGE